MTIKQELFAQAYIETGNASEAYKRAYNTQANANTINRKASQLLKHPEVIKLLADLQAIHRQRHTITIDDILQELEQSTFTHELFQRVNIEHGYSSIRQNLAKYKKV